jgi:hypothetical protein
MHRWWMLQLFRSNLQCSIWLSIRFGDWFGMNIEVVNETNFELLPICIQFNILYFTRIARAASSMLLLNTPALALCSQQDCSRCFLYALAQYSCSCAMLPAGLLALCARHPVGVASTAKPSCCARTRLFLWLLRRSKLRAGHKKSLPSVDGRLCCGRCRIRTYDPLLVRQML